MGDFSVCYVARSVINNALEGHNIASIGIIQAAIGAGINARIVSLEDTSSSPRENFYPIKSILKKDGKTSVFPSIWEGFSSFPAMLTAKKLNCDVIHLLNVTKETFALMEKLLRTKSPCAIHLYHSNHAFSSNVAFRIRALMMRLGLFDYVIASNRSLYSYLIQELGLDKDRVHFIPYPVDVNRFRPRNRQELREKYGIPVNVPVVAYVGAIDVDRGFFFMWKALAKVFRQVPNAVLYISHPSRKMNMVRRILDRYASNQGMVKHVIVGGANPKIEEIYSLADVVSLPFQKPYWITAPPLVLLEAMASATPIVTTPLDVIGEIGTNMSDMIFTEPGNLDSFADAVVYALENADKVRKIGLKARENAMRNYSMETVGKELRETYKIILDAE